MATNIVAVKLVVMNRMTSTTAVNDMPEEYIVSSTKEKYYS